MDSRKITTVVKHAEHTEGKDTVEQIQTWIKEIGPAEIMALLAKELNQPRWHNTFSADTRADAIVLAEKMIDHFYPDGFEDSDEEEEGEPS